jgi:hypothetical protein
MSRTSEALPSLKTVTSRWPDGIKSGAVFTFPSTH